MSATGWAVAMVGTGGAAATARQSSTDADLSSGKYSCVSTVFSIATASQSSDKAAHATCRYAALSRRARVSAMATSEAHLTVRRGRTFRITGSSSEGIRVHRSAVTLETARSHFGTMSAHHENHGPSNTKPHILQQLLQLLCDKPEPAPLRLGTRRRVHW